MATSRATQRPLKFQNENSSIQMNKATVSGKTNGSETATKKGGEGLGVRKALNDITNKSSTNQAASSKKKNIRKQEFNVAEEAFLHDHKKCIKAQQQPRTNTFYLDLVLPGHDSVNTAEYPPSEEGKTDSPPFDLIEQEDLFTSEFSDRMEASTQRKSPPYSPIGQDALPSSPVACKSKDVEFVLNQ
ncbi:hypothetical protein SLEP1_g35587 [Rubroshorea leprosula]|uniref:Uncharacterized protein n=1 Tax=Rubroshorea leprosula TaxID=152421 RepID=A0AAV5KP50_9ROSI|nr:hypothetical protein SLEP1_g35587 [Rubroshorea leprosula]